MLSVWRGERWKATAICGGAIEFRVAGRVEARSLHGFNGLHGS